MKIEAEIAEQINKESLAYYLSNYTSLVGLPNQWQGMFIVGAEYGRHLERERILGMLKNFVLTDDERKAYGSFFGDGFSSQDYAQWLENRLGKEIE